MASFLEEKTLIGKQAKPYMALLYGQGGVGKSTIAAQAESPFFLDLEGGAFHLDVPKSADLISDPNMLLQYMNALLNEVHEYKTIVIDSLSTLETIMTQSVFAKHSLSHGGRAKSIEDYGYGKGYIYLVSAWQGFMGMVKKMNNKGLNVILIGHRKIGVFETPNGSQYKYYTVNLFDSDKNSVLRLVTEQCDLVAFIAFDNRLVDSESQGIIPNAPTRRFVPKKKSLAPRLSMNRMIYTEGTLQYYAKSRYDLAEYYTINEWEWSLLSIQNQKETEVNE